jgi:hypothetical protein
VFVALALPFSREPPPHRLAAGRSSRSLLQFGICFLLLKVPVIGVGFAYLTARSMRCRPRRCRAPRSCSATSAAARRRSR